VSEPIPGLKTIYHNAGGIDGPDDPSFPYKLEANFRPPGFMEFAFVGLHGGSEEFIIRSMTMMALEEFFERMNFHNHPRLRRFVVTGPSGPVAGYSKYPKR